MMWDEVAAISALLSGLFCVVASRRIIVTSRRADAEDERRREESSEMSGRLHALTEEDKAWLRSRGWNGAIRWTRRPR